MVDFPLSKIILLPLGMKFVGLSFICFVVAASIQGMAHGMAPGFQTQKSLSIVSDSGHVDISPDYPGLVDANTRHIPLQHIRGISKRGLSHPDQPVAHSSNQSPTLPSVNEMNQFEEPEYSQVFGHIEFAQSNDADAIAEYDPMDPSDGLPGEMFVEKTVSDLLGQITDFKVASAKDPHLLESEYPRLKAKFSDLTFQFIQLDSRGYIPSEKAIDEFESLSTIFEMMDLNCAMREQGCGPQLDLVVPGKENADSSQTPKNLLQIFIEKKESFLTLLSKCFDKDYVPRMQDDDFDASVGAIRAQFETLKNECEEFISQGTVLSQILEEELLNTEGEISNLVQLSRTTREPEEYPENHPSHQSYPMEESPKYFKDIDDSESRHHPHQQEKLFRELEYNLMSAYEVDYHDNEYVDFDAFITWRKRLITVCDGAYYTLLQANYPETPAKKALVNLLEAIDHELSSKINSFLLAVTNKCSGVAPPEENNLKLFSLFQEIVKGDIHDVEVKLEKIRGNFDEIIASVDVVGMEESRRKLDIEKALLERTSQYIKSMKWTNLPEAIDVNILQQEAYARLEGAMRILDTPTEPVYAVPVDEFGSN
ncbi:hypothetical protein JCM33374_g3254 [Metschnikowia sp. JCM 33374]|nr:hypothetical protein JCM33374_g3254 [Metschnikowia sp. JCM 33374]